ncbi:MAG: MBL fold metallo-hydrolase [Methanoculleus sp. SDB]|nr:MAG: MBL fold metallo-hydrolase [Methanoculleus sp. SDB]
MQIIPSVHALRHPFKIPVAPGIALDRFVYSYVVFGETITLVDTGVAGSGALIFDAVRSAGRDPSEIALIVLTHSHPDHIGAARTIRQETQCNIAAHPAERVWIEDVARQNRERPVPGFDMLVGGPVKVDIELLDGMTIEPDGMRGEIEVIHTPGHSPGSVSLFLHDENVLCCGDAVPVRGDLPVYDDALASVRSVERLRNRAGIKVLLSAWDEPRYGGEAYRVMDEGILYLQAIHEAVLSCAGAENPEPMALARDVAAVLGLPPGAVSPLLARTFLANVRVRDKKSLIDTSL